MEYEYRRRKNTSSKKPGSFAVRLTACAIILCICSAAKYSGIGKAQLKKLSHLISYNTDIKAIAGKTEKKEFKAPLSGTITTGFNENHRGVDIAADENTPVTAAGEGAIIEAGENGDYCNCVQIIHADDSITLYAHLSSVSVNKGDVVKQGTEIGKVGSTGDSTGPHLHFEIIRNGEYKNPQDLTEGL